MNLIRTALLIHRRLLAISVFALILFAPAQSMASAAFNDVTPDDMYYPAIELFNQQNLIVGYTSGGKPTGKLGPKNQLNRAEFTKITTINHLLESIAEGRLDKDIKNYLGVDLNTFTLRINTLLQPYYKADTSKKFVDVADKDINCAQTPTGCNPWYSQYINYTASLGTIKGVGSKEERRFAPEETIKRLYALKMIVVENGEIPANQDRKFQRLTNDERIKYRQVKCLTGLDDYILGSHGGAGNQDAQNLLAYAMLADKLDVFGNNCQALTNAGISLSNKQAIFDHLMKPVKREEIARYFALTTSIPQLQLNPSTDPTVDIKGARVMNYVVENNQTEEGAALPNNYKSLSNAENTGKISAHAEVEPTTKDTSETYSSDVSDSESIEECKNVPTDRENSKTLVLQCVSKLKQANYSEDEIDRLLKEYGLWSLVEKERSAEREQGIINLLVESYTAQQNRLPDEALALKGRVRSGDTLEAATARLNKYYGTSYTAYEVGTMNGIYQNSNDSLTTFDIIKIGTLDGWQPPEDPDEVNVDYWDALTVEKQKILHYHRNAYQMGKLPENLDELVDEEWGKIDGDALAHNVGTTGNSDYRGKDWRTGQQAIYDTDGNLVSTPENTGTYDFISPIPNFLKHGRIDVDPWIVWGNSPQDTTSKSDRICAMSKDKKGKFILNYLNYDYESCD